MNETSPALDRWSTGRRLPWKWIGTGAAAIVVLYFGLVAILTGGPIAITADEYSFDGTPRRLTTGEHRFQLRNTGDEPHEMVIVRLGDGISSVDEVLALPEEEAMTKVEVIGQAQAGPGSKSEMLTVNLDAGRYALLCFIPTGDGGPPHFEHGMKADFVVQ